MLAGEGANAFAVLETQIVGREWEDVPGREVGSVCVYASVYASVYVYVHVYV